MEAAREGVAARGGLADPQVAAQDVADVAGATAALGMDAGVEGVDKNAQGSFASGSEDFAQEFGAIAGGETGAAVAGGEGVGEMPEKDEKEGRGGGESGGPRGLGQAGRDFGDGQEAAGEGEAVAEGFFGAVEEGVGEFAEKAAVDDEAAGPEAGEEEDGADGGESAPVAVLALREGGGIESATGVVEDFFGGAEERFGGEEGQGLAEGVEGEVEELAGAFAGDAQFEAGIAQLGFVEGRVGGGIAQAMMEVDDVGEARRQEEGEPFRQGQARRLALAGGAAPGGDAREQRAVIGVEGGARGRRFTEIAEPGESGGAEGGEDAGGQAAGRQGGVAEGFGSGKCRGLAHRFGAVEEATKASYSAGESSFFSTTSSRRVRPMARDSWTSCATRS